jgi:hypothetical protein
MEPDPAQLAIALLTEHRHDPGSNVAIQDLMEQADSDDIGELHEVIRTLGETLFSALAMSSYFMSELDKTGPTVSADDQLRHFAARYAGDPSDPD